MNTLNNLSTKGFIALDGGGRKAAAQGEQTSGYWHSCVEDNQPLMFSCRQRKGGINPLRVQTNKHHR